MDANDHRLDTPLNTPLWCLFVARHCMRLNGFCISEDFIALECDQKRYDLHNNFVFQGLTYSSEQRTLNLLWRRGRGDWVNPAEPAELRLSFARVYLFKTQERNSELPFTEDNCLDSIGFMWDDLAAEMQAFTSSEPKDGCTHLIANFVSGLSIKIGAESATLHIGAGARIEPSPRPLCGPA